MIAWWNLHGKAVAGTFAATLIIVLPSIIRGAKDYPRVQNWLSVLLDLLSVLQPKDSPGTFKAPLTRATPPGAILDDTGKNGPGAPPVKAVLLVLLGLGLASSCCHSAQCKKAEQVIVDCTAAALKAQSSALMPKVFQLISDPGSSDWQGGLHMLEASAGAAVGCAVQEIWASFKQPKPGAALPPNAGLILNRADAFLTTHRPMVFKVN